MAIQTHPSFRPPDDLNLPIWRYMSFEKLLSFVVDRSLYLTRMDKLEDPLEGRFPPTAAKQLDEKFARTEHIAGRETEPNPQFAEGMGLWVRRGTFVSCWCGQSHESEALWRIYAPSGGVALRTTYAKLAGALPGECLMGCVEYLDYARESPSSDNFHNLVVSKRKFFEYEREIRVAMTVQPLDLLRPLPPRDTPRFLTVPFDLSAIECVVVSPYSPKWMFPLIQDLLRKYQCPFPAVQSAMLEGN